MHCGVKEKPERCQAVGGGQIACRKARRWTAVPESAGWQVHQDTGQRTDPQASPGGQGEARGMLWLGQHERDRLLPICVPAARGSEQHGQGRQPPRLTVEGDGPALGCADPTLGCAGFSVRDPNHIGQGQGDQPWPAPDQQHLPRSARSTGRQPIRSSRSHGCLIHLASNPPRVSWVKGLLRKSEAPTARASDRCFSPLRLVTTTTGRLLQAGLARIERIRS